MSNGNGWMPLYIGDYLADTMELDAAQHGAYLLLLMHYWRNGPLPVEDAKLAQIARTDLRIWKKTVGPIVKAFFREANGRLHQKRADLELAKATECHEKAKALREGDADRLRRWRQQRQMPTREWDELRVEIFARDGNKCQRCGSTDDLHCDHILELSDGGTNDHDNLITLCRTCHSRKTAQRPKPNGEMPTKRISKAFPEHITEHIETASEMPLKPVLQAQQQLPVQEERKLEVTKTPFFSGTAARAEQPPDALEAVLSDAGVTPPEPGTVGAEVVQMAVRRTAKAMEMRIPYGEVRSAEAQIEAMQAQPKAVGAEATMGLRWRPADPIRTVEEQLAWLRANP